MARQSDKFDSEKKVFQQRAATLEEEKRGLHRQVEEANLTNQTLQDQLNQAQCSLEQLSLGCNSLNLEKEELRHSLDALQKEFQSEMNRAQQQLDIRTKEAFELGVHIESLNRQLDETRSAKNAFEQSIQELTQQKMEMNQTLAALEQNHLELQSTLSENQTKFQSELEEVSSQLQTSKLQIAGQSQNIAELEEKLQSLHSELATAQESTSLLTIEKQQLIQIKADLEQQNSLLASAFESSKQEFAERLEKANGELELATTRITDFIDTTSSLKSQLEAALQEKLMFQTRSTQLEAERNQLCQERDLLQQEVQQLLQSAQLSQEEFQTEKDGLVTELESKKHEISEQANRILSAEQRHIEATQHISRLEETVRSLEQETAELLASRSFFEQQISVLQATVDTGKVDLQVATDQAKEEAEARENLLTQHKETIQTLQVRLENLSDEKNVLEAKIVELGVDKESLDQQLASLENSRKEDQAAHDILVAGLKSLQATTQQQLEAYQQQMAQKLEEQQQLNHALKDDCARLERERETLHFEKSGFEQMYLEVKSAYEESENKIQVESELARQEVEAKEQQMIQQSETLERMLNSLRQEKETTQSNYALKIQLLEAEKQELMDSQRRMEQLQTALSASSEAAHLELQQKLAEANRKLEEHAELLRQSRVSRKQTEEQMGCLTATVAKLEYDLSLAVEEKSQLSNEMSVLQAVHGEMKNLELAMEQLTTEIAELSCKKANLEKLREVLEVAKANAEDESAQLRQEVQCKEVEIIRLSGKIEDAESHMEQGQREKQALRARIFDLESTVSNLSNNATETSQAVLVLEKRLKDRESSLERSVEELDAEKKQSAEAQVAFIQAMSDLQNNESNRRELETTIANLKREIDAEKKLASEQTSSIQVLTEARMEASELAASLQKKLSEMEAEMDKLFKSEALLKKENVRLEEATDANKLLLEKEKEDLAQNLKTMELQITQLTHQLETVSSSYTEMEMECNRLKSNQLQAGQVKAHLEQMSREVEANLQCKVTKLQSRMKNLEDELKSKSDEIVKLVDTADVLKLQLETTVREKETLERDMTERISALTTEKETLLTKTTSFEEENQGLRAELAAEKSKTVQGKGEIVLEHRKEKAALEARLQIAQTQMKSMQEKLVNMTVANNSQAPLEHKISILTSELEATIKAKSELEKKLEDSILTTKEEVHSFKKEEVFIILLYGVTWCTNMHLSFVV